MAIQERVDDNYDLRSILAFDIGKSGYTARPAESLSTLTDIPLCGG